MGGRNGGSIDDLELVILSLRSSGVCNTLTICTIFIIKSLQFIRNTIFIKQATPI